VVLISWTPASATARSPSSPRIFTFSRFGLDLAYSAMIIYFPGVLANPPGAFAARALRRLVRPRTAHEGRPHAGVLGCSWCVFHECTGEPEGTSAEAEAEARADTSMGAESGAGTNAEGRVNARAPHIPTADARAEVLTEVLADVECFMGSEPAVLARYMAAYEVGLAPGTALVPFVGVRGKGPAGRPASGPAPQGWRARARWTVLGVETIVRAKEHVLAYTRA
jgi:hypothetical protein